MKRLGDTLVAPYVFTDRRLFTRFLSVSTEKLMITRNVQIAAVISVATVFTLSEVRPIAVAQEQTQSASQNKVEDIQQSILERFRSDLNPPTDFEKLSAKEIETEIELRQLGRRAALERRAQAVLAEYNRGVREASLELVLSAHADVAEFDLEMAVTSADRVRALQIVVEAARRAELEVREKNSFGAIGGSVSALMATTANRLKWEQRLAKEVLASRPTSPAKPNPLPPSSVPCPPVLHRKGSPGR